jgi:hypothetical protein
MRGLKEAGLDYDKIHLLQVMAQRQTHVASERVSSRYKLSMCRITWPFSTPRTLYMYYLLLSFLLFGT